MVDALIVGETMLLALLAVVVVALLRSYGLLERRLDEMAEPSTARVGGEMSDRIPGPPADASVGERAPDIVGQTVTGDSIHLGLSSGGPNTLLAFLSSGCLTCHTFWDAFDKGEEPLPAEARLIIVTKDPAEESPSRLLELSPQGIPVIQSSAAWEAFEVPGAPFFVYVDGATGSVHGQGSAEQWHQIKSLLRDAILDSELAKGVRDGTTDVEDLKELSPAAARAVRAERAMVAAGIPLDDPSFYVSGKPHAPTEDTA